MIKLLESSKIKLPTVYFINKREEIKEIPIGIPFIVSDPEIEPHLIQILEFETLYQAALRSGYPFNFKQILLDNGYSDLENFGYSFNAYMEFTSSGISEDGELTDLHTFDSKSRAFKNYIKDSSVYVDVQKLKELNVFPIWLDKIEDAIHTNIHNFAIFNSNMYNKKLEGMYGGLELTSPNRNLIIIDISGSIPRGVSSTCLTLAKNLGETFYADLLITGSKSTLYPYEELYKLDITTIYEQNGMDNDQMFFKKLVSERKVYECAIVFGDNDSPCHAWRNNYNTESKTISRAEGKKLCKWEIKKLISFHTNGIKNIAAYADWFTVPTENVEKIDSWVKYLNN